MPSEWLADIAAGAIVTWYMLHHRTDDVRLLGDYQDEAEFRRVHREFADATEPVVAKLIEEGILADCGRRYEDEDDPSIYIRDIRPRKGRFWPDSSVWV